MSEHQQGRFSRGNVLNGILFRSFSEDADSIAAANADDRKRTGDIRCKQLKLNVLGQSPIGLFGQVQLPDKFKFETQTMALQHIGDL